MSRFVTFEYWQDKADKRYHARLRVNNTVTEIGHGYPLRADCIGWIKHLVATSENTPIKLLEKEPK